MHRSESLIVPTAWIGVHSRGAWQVWLMEVLGVAGLVFVGSLVRLPLPFTPVPLTLQTFAVLIAPFLAPRNRAAAGIALYLMAGLAGALGGVAVFASLTGATLGYLGAFLLAPFVTACFRRTPGGVLAGMIAATAMIYLAGAGWLCFYLGIGPAKALALGVAPFLAGDLLKLAAAAALARRLVRT